MKIKLLSYTPDPEELIAQAYGICTGKDTIPVENITKWIEKGHETPVEHAKATFRISEISRACSHQLVRHRIASFSQRSQRYCAETDWKPIYPPTVDGYKTNTFRMAIKEAKAWYKRLREAGVPDEDARFVLPNATPTELMMSANFREWRHVIALRATAAAQWEIRWVANEVHDQLMGIAPHVFGASYA